MPQKQRSQLTIIQQVQFKRQSIPAHLVSLRIIQSIEALTADELLLPDAFDSEILSLG